MEFESKLTTQDNQQALEISPSAAIAAVRAEIEGALVVAKRFPRNQNQALAEIVEACKRPGLAEDAEYVFPRGKKDISGPSIYFAREFARIWGNVRFGYTVTRDEPDMKTIRGFAWDCQTNAYVSGEDSFRKLIYRKQKINQKTGEILEEGGWLEPDERDLRELTNRRASILMRNCLLAILPSDMVDEALIVARMTKADKAAKDPKGEMKKIIFAFASLNIQPTELETYLGQSLDTLSPHQIVQLRGVYKSIAEGNSTWQEYLDQAEEKKPPLKKAEKAQPAAAAPPPPSAAEPPRQEQNPGSGPGDEGYADYPAADTSDGPRFDPAEPPPSREEPKPRASAPPPPASRQRQAAAPPPTEPPPPAQPADRKITKEEFSAFYVKASGEYGWKKEQIQYLLSSLGYASPSAIPVSAMPNIWGKIQAGPPQGA